MRCRFSGFVIPCATLEASFRHLFRCRPGRSTSVGTHHGRTRLALPFRGAEGRLPLEPTVRGLSNCRRRRQRRANAGSLRTRTTHQSHGRTAVQSAQLHTLQVSETTHLYDPHFSGLLLHSCAPSSVLDMKRLEIFALRDISAGEFLTIDYACTEEVLARQFSCECGAPNCRRWITGFRELPDQEGQKRLAAPAVEPARQILP